MWTPMVNVIPEGKSGNAEIKHVTVTESDVTMAAIRGQCLLPGPLCQLLVGNYLTMSDGPEEYRSNREVVQRAEGHVLVAGLGIGMILVPIVTKRGVYSVTVLEKSADVIKLVEEPLRKHLGQLDGPKLKVINADVFTWEWPAGSMWDTIYFDIWADKCTDNLAEISKLKRRYAKRCRRSNPGSWMGAWVETELRRKRRQERESAWYAKAFGFKCGGMRQG